MIHKHPPGGGWITHMRKLSTGHPCPYCPMTPAEYQDTIKAEERAVDERQARVIARGMALAKQEGQKECPLCGIPGDIQGMDDHIRDCFLMAYKAEQVRLHSILKRSYEAVLCLEFPQEEPNKFFVLAKDLEKEIAAVVTLTGARHVHGPLICLECFRTSSRGGLIGRVTALEGEVTDFSLTENGNACLHDRPKFWKGFFQSGEGMTKEVAWTEGM